jgi:hypothetical protein
LTASKWQLFAEGGDYVLPTVSGNSGKFLTTDGVSYNWGEVSADVPLKNAISANETLPTDTMRFSMSTLTVSGSATYTISSGGYHFVMNPDGFALLQ